MRNGFLGAILIVAILLSSGFLYSLPSGGDHIMESNVTDAAPLAHEDNSRMETVNITVYAGYEQNAVNFILKGFSKIFGYSIKSFGFLDEIAVPSVSYQRTIAMLNQLSIEYGAEYFSDNESIGFEPQTCYMPVSLALQNRSIYYPEDIYDAYNYTYVNLNNIDGNGTTIVIVDAYGDPFLGYDVSAFDNLTCLPPVNLVVTYTNTTPLQYNQRWAIETALDVEWAHASAPGARIDLVLAQNSNASLEQALSYAIYHRLGNVISLSWGEPELDYVRANEMNDLQIVNDLFRQAAMEGITVLAASGDYGAYAQTPDLTVDFPASDPYVTGVGGTDLTEIDGNYSETGWGGIINGTSFGSGGGYSSVFGSQWWESAPSFNSTSRGVPDVSADADLSTGVLMVENGTTFEAGGTSLATPIWAGVIARADQYMNKSLGFINPMLYQISRTPLYNKALNQVISGTNGYYNATPGWNPVTGLGTPNVGGLLQAFREIQEPNGFIMSDNRSMNCTGILGNLTVTRTGSLTGNGTDFYFFSLFHSAGNYIKFGYAVNSSGSFALACGSYSGYSFSSSSSIGNTTFLPDNLTMELKWNGFNYTMTLGNFSKTIQIFYPDSGASFISIGAQEMSSDTNLSTFYSARLSALHLLDHNTEENLTYLYEKHFSVIGSGNYSAISGVVTSSGIEIARSENQTNGVVMGNSSKPTQPILLSADFGYPMVENLFSTVNSSSSVWVVNNDTLAGSQFYVTKEGIYNIKEVTPSGNYYRRIFLVPTVESYLNITNAYPSYRASVVVTIDGIYHTAASVSDFCNITVPMMPFNNTARLEADGYETVNTTLAPTELNSVRIEPLEARITVVAFPGSAVVTVNGTVSHSARNEFILRPGYYSYNISQPGYQGYSGYVNLSPGEYSAITVYLKPLNGTLMFSGRVTDERFGFNLTGALVYINSTLYTFTNSTGCFTLFVSPGKYTVNFSLANYDNKSMDVNVTSAVFLNVTMEGQNLNLLPFYSLFVSAAFPFMFFLLYLSWSSKYPVTKFAIYYSRSPDFYNATPHYASSSQTTMLLTLNPFSVYYIEIFGYSSTGQILSSHSVVVYSGSPLYIAISVLIYIGIILYTIVAIRYIRKVFTPPRRY